MAEILLDTQSPPSSPASGQMFIYPESVSKKLQSKNADGSVQTLAGIEGYSAANQTGFSSDTYLTGSSIAIPASLVQAGTMYYLCFDMTKTAAGTATAEVNVRFGTNGSTADTAELTFTFAAGTADADTGIFEVWAHFRSVGASGVLVGMCRCTHHLAVTGLVSTGASGTGIILVTSSAFDTTVANSILGVSFNGGASFSGINTVVQSRLVNV